MPGFVKTAQEVQNIENFLAPSRFTVEELLVEFDTTWEFAREQLPPCFEPVGDQSAGTVNAFVAVSQMQSAYCGPFDCAVIGIWATYGEYEGFYQLMQIISDELAVALGRDVMGEIKKTGTTRVYRDQDDYFATVERRGYNLVSIEATITGEDQGSSHHTSSAFDIKMVPGSNGRGLEYPPRLNVWAVDQQYTVYKTGTGTIRWGESPYDPTGSIPIVSTGGAVYSEYAACYPLGAQFELEDPDSEYARYMWGRGFDDPTHFPVSKRWAQQDPLNLPGDGA